MLAQAHGNGDAPIQGVERNRLAPDAIGARIDMHAGVVETDRRDVIGLDAPKRLLGLVCFAHRENGVAAHLAAQRRGLPQHRVGALVQRHTVPEAVLAHDGHEPIAGVGVSRAQRGQTGRLLGRHIKSDRRRAQHRLSPFGYVLGSLDVAADGLGADISCRADVIGRGPEIPAPQLLPMLTKRWI